MPIKKIDGFVSIVVCCCREEYFKQETRVALRKAVLIQPLTEKQVEIYFSSAGIQLEEAKNAFQEDAELRKIMRTPLMLSIVALAYQGNDQKPSLTGSVEIRTSHIFEFYTRHMLYRAKEDRYKQGKTIRWLSWLAQQMARHNQTEFFLERMQPDWLSDRHAQYQYRNMINRFFFGLAIMIYAGLYACFRGDSVPARPGLFSWVGGGQGNTVLGWMAPGLGAGIQGAASLGLVSLMVQVFVLLLVSVGKLPSLSVKAVWHGLMEGLRVGLSVGIPVGLFSGLILAHSSGLRYGIYRGVGLTIYASLIIGLMNVIRAIVGYNQKKTRKEDKRPINIFDRFINFFLFGACAAFGFGCMYALQEHQIDQLVINYSLIIGFFYGVAFGLANGMNLFQDLGTDIKPAESVIWSWSSAVQNLTENLRQGGVLGLVLSGCVILVIGTMSSFFYGIGYGLRYSLVFGILVGFIGSAAAVLATILTNGWKSSIVDEHQLMRPNEGIRRSMNNALFAACIFGPIGGLLSGIIGGVAFGFVGEITGWPILLAGFAILFSIVFAFAFLAFHGGMAFVEHYFLRYYLYRKGYIPWNYARFLDYAVDRILLYKVGGGYIFSHRLLLEYFANVPLEDENE